MNFAARTLVSSLGNVFQPIMRQALGQIFGMVANKSIESLKNMVERKQELQMNRQTLEDFKKGFQKNLRETGLGIQHIAGNSLKRAGQQLSNELGNQLSKKLYY